MGYFVDLFLFFIVFSLEWKIEQVKIREQLYIFLLSHFVFFCFMDVLFFFSFLLLNQKP